MTAASRSAPTLRRSVTHVLNHQGPMAADTNIQPARDAFRHALAQSGAELAPEVAALLGDVVPDTPAGRFALALQACVVDVTLGTPMGERGRHRLLTIAALILDLLERHGIDPVRLEDRIARTAARQRSRMALEERPALAIHGLLATALATGVGGPGETPMLTAERLADAAAVTIAAAIAVD